MVLDPEQDVRSLRLVGKAGISNASPQRNPSHEPAIALFSRGHPQRTNDMKPPKTLRLLASVTLFGIGLTAARAQTPPPIRVSDNHRFLVTEDGKPFFYLADTAWGLFNMNREDIDLYLKDRAGKRFTVIQAVAAHYTGLERPNPYGATVFIKSASAESPGGVKYEANPEYFKNVDYAADEANTMGMYVAIVAIWGKSYVNEKHSIFDTTGAFNYGKFLGSRYRDKRVIFVLGGDWYPEGTLDIWAAMAAGIREGDGGSHLITFHPTGIQSSSHWYQNDAWLSFNMVQSRHIVLNRSYEIIAQDWNKTPVKPVVDGESAYEGIVDDLVTYKPGIPLIQPRDVRRIAYCAVFAGAAGCAYGSQGVWNYVSPSPGVTPSTRLVYGLPAASLQTGLGRPAGSQMQYLRALIESRPMLTRIPDQWAIVNDPMSTTERIQATRSSDGSYMFIYTSTGRPVRARLRDKIYNIVSGTSYKAWWYDPRNGTATLIGEFPRTESGDRESDVHRGDISREFTPPTSGPGQDWVLVLDDAAKNFPPPGTTFQQ